MSFFPVDDEFAFHPKAIAAGNLALGLWLRAGSWSMKYTTEGHIPEAMVTVLGGTVEDAEALVTVGLWERVTDGYLFHDWDQWGQKKTREDVAARRRADAERKARQRERERAGQRASEEPGRGSHGVTPAGQDEVSQPESHPVSHRDLEPTPTPTPERRTKTSAPRGAAADEAFRRFYDLYPRKREPKNARKAWDKALKSGADAETITAGARRYAAWVKATGTDFVKYPATWLNGGCWDDELTFPDGAPSVDPAEAPEDWLRQQWQTGVVAEIERRTGLACPPLTPPDDADEPGRWLLEQRRNWITDHRDTILNRLQGHTTPCTPALT